MLNNDFIMTTSDTLEGHQILNYLDIVSTQVVKGAGFVADFFAGFSDVFGGKSRAFQGQLDVARGEAMKILEAKARRLGGNAIVGLDLQFGQISGKNTQLLLVTASGTVVAARRMDPSTGKEKPVEGGRISGAEVEHRLQLATYIRQLNDKRDIVTPEFWRFIIESDQGTFAEWIFDYLSERWVPKQANKEVELEVAIEYLRHLDSALLLDLLHRELERNSNWSRFLAVAKELQLVDFGRCLEALGNPSQGTRKRVLSLLSINREHYSQVDVDQLERLCDLIRSSLIPQRKTVEVKKLFGLQTMWVCPTCSAQVALDYGNCDRCGSNVEGFKGGEPTFSQILPTLERKLEVVKGLLAGEPDHSRYVPLGVAQPALEAPSVPKGEGLTQDPMPSSIVRCE